MLWVSAQGLHTFHKILSTQMNDSMHTAQYTSGKLLRAHFVGLVNLVYICPSRLMILYNVLQESFFKHIVYIVHKIESVV